MTWTKEKYRRTKYGRTSRLGDFDPVGDKIRKSLQLGSPDGVRAHAKAKAAAARQRAARAKQDAARYEAEAAEWDKIASVK